MIDFVMRRERFTFRQCLRLSNRLYDGWENGGILGPVVVFSRATWWRMVGVPVKTDDESSEPR